MPSDKRARQRAAREARQAVVERRNRRRTAVRRGVIILVIAAVAGGIYALTRSSKPATTAGKATSTTATTTPVATSVPDSTTTTVSLAGATTAANCPSHFTATTALKKPKFASAPPVIIDPAKTYTAAVRTDLGTFDVALDTKDAPKTANNFVFLAENHFFDCVVFHRVIPGFMDQTGDPTGSGSGGPGYQFADENAAPTGGYTTGEVAMANSGKDTNGSQFFVLDAAYNNSGYSLFGHVTAGQSVVDAINKDGTQAGTPRVLHRIISVTISSA